MSKAGRLRVPKRTALVAAALGCTLLLSLAVSGRAYQQEPTEEYADNPCYGPNRRQLLCPDLRMAPPSHLYISHTPGGRRLLHAQNNIRSRGRGPLELRGIRSGPRRMDVRQRIHRVGGGKRVIRTEGNLDFYPVPGQFRYWKFQNAARFELWTVGGEGRPLQRIRVGPKLHYCLRDLERTKASPNSPDHRVYPACSQNPERDAVVLGTSVGWSDIYPADYHQNYVNVTGLRGCFAFFHEADPKNHIRELNEDNNGSHIFVRLPSGRSVSSC
jgi:hypothetical protein